MKRVISVIVILCMLLAVMSLFVTAEPVLVEEQADLGWTCQEKQVAQKVFTAKTEKIYVGLFCPDNARLIQYACDDQECQSPRTIASTFKIGGELVEFDHFQIGHPYYYECFSCPDATTNLPPHLTVPSTLTVREGEKFVLDASCQDPEGDETFMRISGWMDSLSKQVDFSSAGEHIVLVNCADTKGRNEMREVRVTVEDVNRAPQILRIWNN